MNTNKWIEEKINSYLFDTNLRWSFIHTKIMNMLPISVDEKKEYEGAIESLQDLISKVREEERTKIRDRFVEIAQKGKDDADEWKGSMLYMRFLKYLKSLSTNKTNKE